MAPGHDHPGRHDGPHPCRPLLQSCAACLLERNNHHIPPCPLSFALRFAFICPLSLPLPTVIITLVYLPGSIIFAFSKYHLHLDNHASGIAESNESNNRVHALLSLSLSFSFSHFVGSRLFHGGWWISLLCYLYQLCEEARVRGKEGESEKERKSETVCSNGAGVTSGTVIATTGS